MKLSPTQTAALAKLAERPEGWSGVGEGYPVKVPTAKSLARLGLAEVEAETSTRYGLGRSGEGYRAHTFTEHVARLTGDGRALAVR